MKRASLFLLLIFLLQISCTEDENFKSMPIFSHINVETRMVEAYSAEIVLTHDGTNRDKYIGFYVEGHVSDVRNAIDSFIASKSSEELQLLYTFTQKKHIDRLSKLHPTRTYTYIAFGIDDDCAPRGEPASCTFTTPKSDIDFRANSNWNVVYKGECDYNDVTYTKVSIYVDEPTDDRFFTTVCKVEDVPEDTAEFENFLLEKIDDFDTKENVSGDEDFYFEDDNVRNESTNHYCYLQESGTFVAIAIGIDSNGAPSGLWAKSTPFDFNGYTLKSEYSQLLSNKWKLTDVTGKTFNVVFKQKYANSYLLMYGGQSTTYKNFVGGGVSVRYSMRDKTLMIDRNTISGVDSWYSSKEDLTYSGKLWVLYWCTNEENSFSLQRSVTNMAIGEYKGVNAPTIFLPRTTLKAESGWVADTYGMIFAFSKQSGGLTYYPDTAMQFPIQLTRQ